MVKWIGGAMAAIAVTIGGATLAGEYMRAAPDDVYLVETVDAPEVMPPEGSLANVIPIDEAAISDTGAGTGAGVDAITATPTGAEAANPQLAANVDMPQTTPSATARGAAPKPPVQNAAAQKPKSSSGSFKVKRILDIDGPMKYGEWHWDDKGVPPGPLVVTVDLKARVVSVFQGGYEIGAAVAMLGTKKHPTPTGTFPILRKQRHNVSEKYNNAPMPWSMFLTRSGIAIHGGSVVENGYASHGCIAVPDELASRLFKIAKNGDKVIITNGATLSMGDSII